MLFIAFRVPYSPAIGVKLISTPWTDQNLEHAEGITAEQLRQEHRNKGMPDDLANSLELAGQDDVRSEEHTSELQSLMRTSYAVFCLKKKKQHTTHPSLV